MWNILCNNEALADDYKVKAKKNVVTNTILWPKKNYKKKKKIFF